MKPLVIRLQAFGPYQNEEIVDFKKLSEQGLFLICGETGSGKTTILDAMTFALYGKSSGGMRDQLEAMRCKQSEWGKDTYVVYDFELHQKVYRFERKLECKKVKLSASQNVYMKNAEGVFEPLFENCKEKEINAKAKELIGLDYDQFRQVIILPQGQFEKLLTSNSDEKEKILVSIFGVDKWQKIANNFYEHASAHRNKLLKIKEQLELRLRDENCTSMEEFAEQIANLQKEMLQKQEAYDEADYDGRRKRIEQELEIGRQFATIHELEEKRKHFEEKKAYFAEQNEKLRLAEQADTLKPVIQALVDAQREYQARSRAEQALGEEIEKAIKKVDEAKTSMGLHQAQKMKVDGLQEELIRLEEKRPHYESLQEKVRSYEEKLKIYRQQMQMLEKVILGSQKAQENLQKVSAEFKEARGVYTECSNRYLAGIAGSLAMELEEGKACPVCGSTTHPKKAKLSENAVSEKEVKEKEQQMNLKFEALGKCQAKYQEILKQKEMQEQLCAEQKNITVIAEKELQNAKENLAEGIASIRELEKVFVKLRTEIKTFQEKAVKLEEFWKEKTEEFTGLQAKLSVAKNETVSAMKKRGAAQTALEEALEKTIFVTVEEVKAVSLPHQEMQKIRDSYARYQAEIKHLITELSKRKEVLQGKAEPDLEVCEKELQKIAREKEIYVSESARLQLAVTQKQEKLEMLHRMSKDYVSSWGQAESDWTIAKNLRGDTGIGLQRYVLGIMFSSVIAAANKMLEKVHGGRYRLFRTDEKGHGSNKKGLELKVFDSFSKEGDEGRSVKTLSGGEKFLVSLALSIGMSTIAQRSGTHLDAMFVDEGFGSLDQNSIEDALEVLASIQKADGTVGIISHVQVLQDNIPTKLEIKKSRNGSRIVKNIG